MMSLSLRIAVAAHKDYWMPNEKCYYPVMVGTAENGIQVPNGWGFDAEYDGNISKKNYSYCELTALHWLWTNTCDEYVGLVHYRRYFCRQSIGAKRFRIAHEEDFEARLAHVPLILPTLRHYVIETNGSQYAHAHHASDLDATRNALLMLYPDIVPLWDKYLCHRSGHRFNMLIARRDILDEYCSFLFPVLELCESLIDISNYSDYDKRVFGFLAERLLDPWVQFKSIPYDEMKVVNLENEHWPTKASDFIFRKIRGELRAW